MGKKLHIELESAVSGEIVSEMVLRVYGGKSHNERRDATLDYLSAIQEFWPPISCDAYETKAKQDDAFNDYTEFRYFCMPEIPVELREL